MSVSTLRGLEPATDRELARRRWRYSITTLVLTAIVGLGLVDASGWLDVYGVDDATASASGGGYELTVRHGTVSRPALATPLQITVIRRGGFDAPVTVAVDQRYLALWDENGIVPAPSGETADGEWVIWEFDPPPGDTLTVTYDGRIEPAAQSGRDGAVAILEDGEPVARVDFTTRVLP